MRQIARAALALLLCAALAAMVALPSAALARQASSSAASLDSGSKTIVKVGWYQSSGFQEGEGDSEKKSGYSYEYLQRVADYNGWEYQYVYGDWSELFPKLESGEIDVMGGVSITEERMATMSFPSYAMGSERYCLYQHSADASMDASDISTFKGKKIGAIENNLMTYYLEEWLKENDAHPTLVYYGSFEDRDADFEAGKLDGVVATDNNVSADSGYAPVVKVGEEPYYLAVAKDRTDLLEQLNSALATIQEMDPYFLSNLQYKCFGATVTNATLSKSEEEWLDGHDTLKVGYLGDYLPYCATGSDGNATGLMTDVFSAMLHQLGIEERLTVQYTAYESSGDMVKALTEGDIDAVFPVTGDLWSLEQQDINASTAVVTSGMDLVFEGAYADDKTNCIAVNSKNNLQVSYVNEAYPNAQVKEYGSITECLDAIKNGDAGSTIINGMRADIVRNNRDYEDLSLLQLQDTDSRCIGVRGNNSALLLLINRGLQLIGSDYGANASYSYMGLLYSYGTADFLHDNAWWIAPLVVFVLALIIIVLAMFLRVSRQAQRQAQERVEEVGRLNEELAAARDAANAANDAKTSFLFNMSHDIRTPMNAIFGFTDLLRKHQDEPEKRDNYIGKIQDSSGVLLNIINNVLDMARIESGATTIEESAWSATQFNDSICSVFTEMMADKGIDFQRSIEVEHNYVYCDPTKMTQVFNNILSNAYKYTNPGGRVEMRLVEIPCQREGYVSFRTTISDTGIGMDADFLPHLFEEFSREHTTTEAKVEGTGLGMPIVKRLIDLMDGTVEVTSEKGVGTTFTVTLEHRIAERSDLRQSGELDIDLEQFHGKRILLAEDNDLNAEIAMEILSDANFEVERAEDGAIAVEMLAKAPAGYYDLVLMDIQMPNMNGYEAAAAIRAMEDSAKANITVIAMTANAFEEDKKAAMRAGMNAHVAKPVDVGKLMETLSIALGSK